MADDPAAHHSADPPSMLGWLISLDGTPQRCTLMHMPLGSWWIEDAGEDGIIGGMSGSPILTADGAAVGVIVCGDGKGPNPRLAMHLPGWLLRDLDQ